VGVEKDGDEIERDEEGGRSVERLAWRERGDGGEGATQGRSRSRRRGRAWPGVRWGGACGTCGRVPQTKGFRVLFPHGTELTTRQPGINYPH
jgi:hypothetical protein